MKWSLPLVELSRVAARCASPLFAGAMIGCVLLLNAGCSSLPEMKNAAKHVALIDDSAHSDGYTAAEKQRLSELPAVPDFDVMPPEAIAEVGVTIQDAPAAVVASEEPKIAAVVAAAPAIAETAVAKKADEVPMPVNSKPATVPPQNKVATDILSARVAAKDPTPKKTLNKPESTSRKGSNPPDTKIEQATSTPLSKAEKPTSSDSVPAIPGAGKMGVLSNQESVKVPLLRIDAPKPFGWSSVGKTTGNRSFQTVSVGDEGYRTLVIGSVAGNDPLAVELVEQMARHLHDGKTIFGGFQATIIRTLNPDGEALRKVFNEKGQYINHGFPKDNGVADGDQPVEVTFLLEQIRTLKPQRIIHIRSVDGSKGVIATTVSSQAVAKDAADWLGFRVIKLPEVAVSGSLERHLASSGACEVLTFAMPTTSKKQELWDRYGDALQNLLLGDDAATREMAGPPKPQSSANLLNAEGK